MDSIYLTNKEQLKNRNRPNACHFVNELFQKNIILTGNRLKRFLQANFAQTYF